jgi:hypothetical protein
MASAKSCCEHQRQRFLAGAGLEHLALVVPDQRVERAQVFRQVVDDQQFARVARS